MLLKLVDDGLLVLQRGPQRGEMACAGTGGVREHHTAPEQPLHPQKSLRPAQKTPFIAHQALLADAERGASATDDTVTPSESGWL